MVVPHGQNLDIDEYCQTRASTTSTFGLHVLNGVLEGNAATAVIGDAVQNLVQSGLIRLSDQTASKVFLQGLMRTGGPLAQNSVGVLRNVFDLDARHGAIMHPLSGFKSHASQEVRDMPVCPPHSDN